MGYSQPEQQAKIEAQNFAHSVFKDLANNANMSDTIGLYKEVLRFKAAVNLEVDKRKTVNTLQIAGINAGFIDSVAVFIVNTRLKDKLIETIERLENISTQQK